MCSLPTGLRTLGLVRYGRVDEPSGSWLTAAVLDSPACAHRSSRARGGGRACWTALGVCQPPFVALSFCVLFGLEGAALALRHHANFGTDSGFLSTLGFLDLWGHAEELQGNVVEILGVQVQAAFILDDS
jgi:hypothetical protein